MVRVSQDSVDVGTDDWPIVSTPALAADDIPQDQDPLRGRLVIVSSAQKQPVDRMLRAEVPRTRWRVVQAEPQATAVAHLLVGWDLGTDELGPPALGSATQWLLATRGLLAGLLGADRPAVRGLVLHVSGPAWQVMYLRRIVPDAVFVHVLSEPGEWERRINELAENTDHVTTVSDFPRLARQVFATRPRVNARRQLSPRRPSAGARPRLLLVVGSGRSGTTWLHTMVCSHPGIGGTEQGETSIFRLMQPIWTEGPPDPHLLAALRRFSDETLIDALSAPDVQFVCEKTPAHVWSLPFIRQLYPEARFLHIVRDGRDVAISLQAMDHGIDDLATAGRQWAAAVTAVETGLTGAESQVRTVRYEQLAADPVSEVRGIWEWLGLSRDGRADEVLAQRTKVQVTPIASRRAPGSQRWRDLADADLDALVHACGPTLQRWGYLAGQEQS